MWFGVRSLDEADGLAGATLAHSIATAGGKRFRKGRVLTADDLDLMRAGGIDEITVAIPDRGDIMEDEAAALVADAMESDGIRRVDVGTGRVNFHAQADGVFTVKAVRVAALNRIDPAVTVATLPNHATVKAGQMIATVKIIPFAVARGTVERAVAEVAGGDTLAVHSFREGLRVALIQTRVPGVKESVLDKTRRVTDERLAPLKAVVVSEMRTGHTAEAVAGTLAKDLIEADMALVFGASAVTDRRDVIPRGIEMAGGTILHVGMPVDPGNLLVMGEVSGKPVIGAPGCARSPKENGFDWVLQRLCAGIDVTPDDIVAMGVGGLLTEIPVRPHPRESRGGSSSQ